MHEKPISLQVNKNITDDDTASLRHKMATRGTPAESGVALFSKVVGIYMSRTLTMNGFVSMRALTLVFPMTH
jgi:hypothetical protein